MKKILFLEDIFKALKGRWFPFERVDLSWQGLLSGFWWFTAFSCWPVRVVICSWPLSKGQWWQTCSKLGRSLVTSVTMATRVIIQLTTWLSSLPVSRLCLLQNVTTWHFNQTLIWCCRCLLPLSFVKPMSVPGLWLWFAGVESSLSSGSVKHLISFHFKIKTSWAQAQEIKWDSTRGGSCLPL